MQTVKQQPGDAFRGLVQRNRAAGRLEGRQGRPRSGRQMVPAGLNLHPEDLERAQRMAEHCKRARSDYMRLALLKQLAADEAEIARDETASTGQQ